jgi:hypothetical protein
MQSDIFPHDKKPGTWLYKLNTQFDPGHALPLIGYITLHFGGRFT